MPPRFAPGIDTLLGISPNALANRRVGLVTHPAALNLAGCTTDELLAATPARCNLVSLFAAEHGFFSAAGAGKSVPDMLHPLWNIPIRSLYAATRRPTDEMLKGLDQLVFDMQDISIRPYTYGSTLRLRGMSQPSGFRQTPLRGF